jgi:metallophosphoesterase superfamily enzyme
MSRVLVIGDLHEPFCLNGYLAHCKQVYKRFNCNKVVFIGDIIDSHYSSFHDTNPDGFSAIDELNLSIKKLSKWYKAFPVATVIIGNHDRIVNRKALSNGISAKWIKEYSEVLKVKGWNFTTDATIDNVLYVHGEGSSAFVKAKALFCSVVAGHTHTKCYIEFINDIFGMQVGCGVDKNSYAMAYAKNFAPPQIACAIVIDGKLPILVKMYE